MVITFSFEHAHRVILAEKGKHFDPLVVESFERNMESFEEIHTTVRGEESGW